MKTGIIQQEITFQSSTNELFELLMDEKKHSQITGGDVSMSREIGGNFSVFDDYCTGFNLEIIPGTKIVQKWRFEEEGWPEDHYSVCTFEFFEQGASTTLKFTQTEIPEHKVIDIIKGWNEFYWERIHEYLTQD